MQTFHHTYTSVLTPQDMKKHLPYPLHIPPGTRSLQLRLAYAPQVVEQTNNLITLTLLDPQGFRGSAHRHVAVLEAILQEDAASPGFVAGPILPGEWLVLLDTHMILPGAPVAVELEATGDDCSAACSLPGSTAAAAAPSAPRPAGGAGWYRGDLHTHTFHSDAEWDVAGLLDYARANQLDFLALTDHNTISGLAEFERRCPDGLAPIYGSELTTFWGHALALGRREWADWRIEAGRRSMAQVAAEVEAQGGLFVIAHPEAIGDPYCTGCHWSFSDTSPGQARVVEVWNSPWVSESNNQAGLELAYHWMNQGLRMALTAGSDCHGGSYAASAVGFNVVYADDLHEAALLQAIRAGRLYMSCGPRLDLAARVGGTSLMMGDSCRAQVGETIYLHAEWNGGPAGARLELIVDGAARAGLAGEDSAADWELPGGQTGWALLTLRAPSGDMLALTNPIYFDGR